jgi:hypothetical protein
VLFCLDIAHKVSKFEMLAVVGNNSNNSSGGHGSSSMDLARDSPPKNLWFYKVSWTLDILLAEYKTEVLQTFPFHTSSVVDPVLEPPGSGSIIICTVSVTSINRGEK